MYIDNSIYYVYSIICKGDKTMGMTIDKAIAKIWHCIVSIRESAGNKEFIEALELSIETMRKYQKIEQIVKETDDLSTIKCSISFGRIKEVVEDEKR